MRKMKIELEKLEKRVVEEETLKNREKNLVMQKENRIKVLEDKIKQIEDTK